MDTPPDPPTSGRLWTVLVVLLVGAVLLKILSRTVADPDLWGHVLFGLEHLRSGELARTDRYSYLTRDHPWINHEWLAELTLGWLYANFGSTGLIIFKTAVVLLVTGALYAYLTRRGLDPLRGGVVVILSAYLLTTGASTVRPQLFTFLFFLLVLLCLEAAERGVRRWLWMLPLIFLLWINFHGGVLAGLGVVGIWAAAQVGELLFRRDGRAARPPVLSPLGAAGLVLACGLATLVNPYGWRLPEFLLRTATVPRPEIMDWQPLAVASVEGGLYLLIGTGTWAALWVAARRGHPPSLSRLALLVVLTILPLNAYRHLQLFAIGLPALGAQSLATAWRAKSSARGDGAPRQRPALLAAAGLATILMVVSSVPNFRCIAIDPESTMAFPTRAMAWLGASDLEGNLLVSFTWGQYAIWHLGDRMKVSMDGRRETVYPPDVYARYLQFRSGTGDWNAFVRDRAPDAALLPTGSPVANLLDLESRWRVAYRDRTATILLPAPAQRDPVVEGGDHPLTPAFDRLPSDGRNTCFP